MRLMGRREVAKCTAYLGLALLPGGLLLGQSLLRQRSDGAASIGGVGLALNETIDFFSAEGRALRSQLSVSMSQQDIPADLLRGSDPGGDIPSPGINFQTPVKLGDTFQSLAGDLGAQDGWQDLAFINDIEDPRNLDTGTLLTLGG